jgi:hypothetical protein
MITVNFSENPDEKWNDRLLKTENGNIYQTIEFSQFVEKTTGKKPTFLKFFNESGEIIAQLLLTKHSSLSNQNSIRKIIKNILGTQEIYRWRYGPIIFNKNYVHEVYSEFQKFLLKQKFRIKGTEIPFNNTFNIKWNEPFISETWATFLIDLSKPKEIIWNNMEKHSVRKNIQRSQKRGVEVREMQSSDLPHYFKMLQETKQKTGSFVTYEELTSLWKTLRSVGQTGFLAYKEKQPVGGLIISSFNGFINEWGVARSKFDFENKLYSQDYIKWKIIEWGIEKGCKFYDLSGVDPNPTSTKGQGILKYKMKFGGKLSPYDIIKS